MKSLVIYLLLFLASISANAAILEEVQFKDGDRVGIFIGTFAPPHAGHDEVMRMAIRKLSLDYVIIVPNDLALHKQDAAAHSFRHYLTNLAYKNDPKILVPSSTGGTPVVMNVFRYLMRLETQQNIRTQRFGIMGSDVATSTTRRLLWIVMPWISNLTKIAGSIHFWSGFAVSSRDSKDVIPNKIGTKEVTLMNPAGQLSSTKMRSWMDSNIEKIETGSAETYMSLREQMSPHLHRDVFDAFMKSLVSERRASRGLCRNMTLL